MSIRIPEDHSSLYGSEKTGMMVSETWEDFESALTSVLLDLEGREIITIKLAEGEILFIQFAGLGSLKGVNGIRAEFFMEGIKDDRGVSTASTPEQRAFFTQAGFAVAKEGLVWRRDYPWPVPSHTVLKVVTACITCLRNVAGIDSPQQLCYMVWRYPTQREALQGEEYIPGEIDLPISEFGIPHEQIEISRTGFAALMWFMPSMDDQGHGLRPPASPFTL